MLELFATYSYLGLYLWYNCSLFKRRIHNGCIGYPDGLRTCDTFIFNRYSVQMNIELLGMKY